MKALTLTQPWATLVAIGAKQYETRSWYTTYRGPLAIHAAKGGYNWLSLAAGDEVSVAMCRALNAGGYASARELPLGAVVAVGDLVRIYRTQWIARDARAPLSADELAFGDYTPGRYAWLLANVRRLPEPIPARGSLGLWDWYPVATTYPPTTEEDLLRRAEAELREGIADSREES